MHTVCGALHGRNPSRRPGDSVLSSACRSESFKDIRYLRPHPDPHATHNVHAHIRPASSAHIARYSTSPVTRRSLCALWPTAAQRHTKQSHTQSHIHTHTKGLTHTHESGERERSVESTGPIVLVLFHTCPFTLCDPPATSVDMKDVLVTITRHHQSL